jgi:Flp pilus assembly protein TadG
VRSLSAQRDRLRRQRGGLAVEFALVLPLLLAIVFGTVDVGRLVMSQCMLSYAVSVGARTGAAFNTAAFANVQTAVQNASAILAIPAASIHYQLNAGATDTGFGGRTPGSTFKVFTTYSYQPVFIRQLGSRTLNASCTVTIQ